MPTFGVVGSKGIIHMPEGKYRASWSSLGSWKILDEDEVIWRRVVCTSPGVFEHHLDLGAFPDRAVLIEELLQAKAGDCNTGSATCPTDITDWFVTVEHKHDRFDGNDLLGLGWGWVFLTLMTE